MERNTFPDIPNEILLDQDGSILDFRAKIGQIPIAVDMGCGHGDYLIEYAAKNPNTFYVGIEISRKRVFKTSARLSKRQIKNYAVVDSSGELALRLLFPENSVDELHVNFPDPWLRKRHWKNRIFKPSFLIEVYRVLRPEGKLYFVSDVAEYAEHVFEILSGFPGLKSDYPNGIEKNLYNNFPTLFYQKMSPLRPINYICFSKKA